MSENELNVAIELSEEELKKVDGGAVQYRRPEEKPGFVIYKIKDGDTLSRIAGNHRCTVKDIMAWNPYIINPSRIYAGAYLYIMQ